MTTGEDKNYEDKFNRFGVFLCLMGLCCVSGANVLGKSAQEAPKHSEATEEPSTGPEASGTLFGIEDLVSLIFTCFCMRILIQYYRVTIQIIS